MVKAPNVPKLSDAEEDRVYNSLQRKFPSLDDDVLRSLSQGNHRAAQVKATGGANRPESSNEALETCLALAKDMRDGLLQAADGLSGWQKALAIAGAHATYIVAQISCRDDHG
ncbi:hypothetical protein [uncultured Enterovirga sp.]|uniref:hypothetical protein n=1 Tax=uncultured Enterovirga sp. TaxID=2026352 RepID=UPI0035CC5F0B